MIAPPTQRKQQSAYAPCLRKQPASHWRPLLRALGFAEKNMEWI
jgi:hypothetical protein